MNKSFPIIEYDQLVQESGSMDDVVGLEGFKDFLTKLKSAIQNVDKYNAAGVRLPKGVIFSGPPGTGKTLVARHAAKFLGYHYMYVSPSHLTSPVSAITTRKIEQMFNTAREQGQVVVFIDEIDGLIKDRAKGGSDGGGALQKFLEMLDGTDNKENPNHILVLVATNHIEHLDAAFIRPGRFDEKVLFTLPGEVERREFITKNFKEDIDVDLCVELTDALSYAELNEFVRKAKSDALYYGVPIDMNILLTSLQAVSTGANSNKATANPTAVAHLIPHLVGHTLAYTMHIPGFTMGTSVDSAQLICSPKLVRHRIVTQKDLLVEAISIAWAHYLEVEFSGGASTLVIEDQLKLSIILDKLLTMLGSEQSSNLNKNKLKRTLSIAIYQFIKAMAKVDQINKLTADVKDEYMKKGILPRKRLKELMSQHNISEKTTANWYNGLLSLIQKQLNLELVDKSGVKPKSKQTTAKTVANESLKA